MSPEILRTFALRRSSSVPAKAGRVVARLRRAPCVVTGRGSRWQRTQAPLDRLSGLFVSVPGQHRNSDGVSYLCSGASGLEADALFSPGGREDGRRRPPGTGERRNRSGRPTGSRGVRGGGEALAERGSGRRGGACSARLQAGPLPRAAEPEVKGPGTRRLVLV